MLLLEPPPDALLVVLLAEDAAAGVGWPAPPTVVMEVIVPASASAFEAEATKVWSTTEVAPSLVTVTELPVAAGTVADFPSLKVVTYEELLRDRVLTVPSARVVT